MKHTTVGDVFRYYEELYPDEDEATIRIRVHEHMMGEINARDDYITELSSIIWVSRQPHWDPKNDTEIVEALLEHLEKAPERRYYGT